MIQYKIYKDRALYPAWIIETIVRGNLISTPPREAFYNSYVSNLKELAGVEIDTRNMVEWFLTPLRLRCFK